MTDPKEKEKPEEQQHTEDSGSKTDTTKDSNWDKHQRIDEEGNELDPEDIK